MEKDITVFVGLDTSKMKISVALAEDGRQVEIRFFGDINSAPDTVKRFIAKLSAKYSKLSFCYEAGPTGYGSKNSGMSVPSSRPLSFPKSQVSTSRRTAEMRSSWRGSIGLTS
jgi:hypothetical protein